MYKVGSFVLLILMGYMTAKFGWIALLWCPLGFMFGIFSTSNIVLPILLGFPIATSLILKMQMRAGVYLALLRTPIIWLVQLFLIGFFFPSAVNWVSDNQPLNIAAIFGFLLILLSPISKKVRDDFRSDFDKAWGGYYTIEKEGDKSYLALLFYKAGFEALDKNNYNDAIQSFSRSIDIFKELQINEENEKLLRELFYNRGHCKDELKNYTGAIDDYNLAIEYGGGNIDEREFVNRALAKFELGYYEDAINDYNQVIEINPKNAKAYFGRGNAKYKNNYKDGACNDWKESEKLGFVFASEFIENYCKK